MTQRQRRPQGDLASVTRGDIRCVRVWSFDQDGSSFSILLNTICVGISEDLMPGELDLGGYRLSRNPVAWD